jgi:hypothetical protein
MHLVLIFIAGFTTVFLYGFQSRNVNCGDYGWAVVTSFAISLTTVTIWEMLDTSGWTEIVVYGLSGACGVTCSMLIHKRFVEKKKQ